MRRRPGRPRAPVNSEPVGVTLGSARVRALNPTVADLVRLLGRDAVLEPEHAPEHLHDATESAGRRGWADAVVLPGTEEQVAAAVGWCFARGVPVVPRGGGSGFAGGAVPQGGVVLSLERLDRIRRMEPELWRMEVEAGVRTARVQRAARECGLYFPPDPGAAEQSMLGGNLACNAGGPHSFKYGVIRAWTLAVRAVTGTGEVVGFGSRARKDVAGYDLTSLLIGSEGTLGVITGAVLRLIPAPEAAYPVVAAYPSLATGVAAMGRVYGSGLQPATLEYLDAGALAAGASAYPGELPPGARLLVIAEADGSAPAAAVLRDELIETFRPGAMMVEARSAAGAIRDLWRWRGGVAFAVMARRGGKLGEDVCVPFERLEEAIALIVEIGERVGVPACSWGHAGDGNLHANFMLEPGNLEQYRRAREGCRLLFDQVYRWGGTASGEHGLGADKAGELDRQYGPAETALMRKVKAAFDPAGILNPGKKVTLRPPV